MAVLAPGAYVTPASPLVVEQMSRLNNHADHLLNRTENVVNNILNLRFSNVDLDPRFQFSQDDLNALLNQLGPLPDVEMADWTAGLDLSAGNENFVFNPLLLQRLQERFGDLLELPQPPEAPPQPPAPPDPVDLPDILPPQKPVLENYQAPQIDTNIPVPQYEDATAEVPFPTLRPIELPPVPQINLDDITFQGVPPVFEGVPPDIADFSFTPDTYTAKFIPQVEQALNRMFAGGTGLPPEVEDALFERAREREVELGEREVDQIQNEWAARGHRYPAGPMHRRVDLVRKEVSYKVSQLNREQFIEHWRIHIEQLRQALTTALAAEDVLLRVFSQAEELRFQAAQFRLQMAIQIFNAFVSKYQADASLFQVQAQVYRDRIQAEMAKLEAFNAQLRGQQLIGELNMQDVQIFAERLRALQVNVEVYKARIEAFVAQHEALRTQVSLYRSQLENNLQLVNVYEAETRAFAEMVRAQTAKEERFQTKAAIYGRQIEAWRTLYQGLMEQYNAQLELQRLKRDIYAADSERLGQWASAESARIRALTDKYQAIATEIGARSEAERTKYQLYLAVAQAALERYRAAADILLKNAEVNIQSGLTAQSLYLRAQETGATTLAQLAAGMTSAAGIQASISDSSGSSVSYNFSGELDVV